MRKSVSNQRDYPGASPKEIFVSERHWEEEQRSILGRLFDSIFGRREAAEDEIDSEIRWLHTLKKHLDDEDCDAANGNQKIAGW
jgi:hypothetical protein